MLKPEDYLEPECALCGGKALHNPEATDSWGRMPVLRIIEKLDKAYAKNDMAEATRLLEYWQAEAVAVGDKPGELAIVDEMLGLYRKTADWDKAQTAISRAEELLPIVGNDSGASVATVYLNMATTLKACGKPAEALPYYDKTFAIYSSRLTADDPLWGGYWNNKALALADLGRYEEAEACYKQALQVVRQQPPQKQIDLSVTYVNMAHLYEARYGRDCPCIVDSLYEAMQVLTSDELPTDGYTAYVLEKCYPSFAYYGYTVLAEDMAKRSKELYARA